MISWRMAARISGERLFCGLFFAVAGIAHFARPDIYVRIVPPPLPWPLFLVLASGAAELALGLLLLPRRTAPLAAGGLIVLLVAVFPANLYMALAPERFPGIPEWLLWLRLPLQGLFVAWVRRCARPRP